MMHSAPPLALLLALAGLALLAFPVVAPGPASAQEAVEIVEIGPGKLADPVVCATAPELSYALYLPTSYDPDRSEEGTAQRLWPVVFLFDSEGRGAGLLERFRHGADLFGFALVASNDTARDTAWELNQRVVRILLADAFRHVAIDSSRLHFAGFSGTARLAWSAGVGFRDAVGGVLLMGGTTPGSELPKDPPPFPVFAITGTEDFNHDEVVRLHNALDELSHKARSRKNLSPSPHRLEVFDGGNEWPPQELATDALGWFYLQHLRERALSGTPSREPRARAEGLENHVRALDRLLDEDLDTARQQWERGDLLGAVDRYRGIVEDYGGWVEDLEAGAQAEARTTGGQEGTGRSTDLAAGVAQARTELAKLEDLPEVKKARSAARDRQNDAEIYRADLRRAIQILRADPRPPQPNRLLNDLKIPLLQKRLDHEDPEEVRNARRMLEMAYVHTYLYLPPELMAVGLYRHAASSLTVAAAIHPENPELWLGIARAYAKAGERTEALDALARARETGASEAEIAADQDLAALATED